MAEPGRSGSSGPEAPAAGRRRARGGGGVALGPGHEVAAGALEAIGEDAALGFRDVADLLQAAWALRTSSAAARCFVSSATLPPMVFEASASRHIVARRVAGD